MNKIPFSAILIKSRDVINDEIYFTLQRAKQSFPIIPRLGLLVGLDYNVISNKPLKRNYNFTGIGGQKTSIKPE